MENSPSHERKKEKELFPMSGDIFQVRKKKNHYFIKERAYLCQEKGVISSDGSRRNRVKKERDGGRWAGKRRSRASRSGEKKVCLEGGAEKRGVANMEVFLAEEEGREVLREKREREIPHAREDRGVAGGEGKKRARRVHRERKGGNPRPFIIFPPKRKGRREITVRGKERIAQDQKKKGPRSHTNAEGEKKSRSRKNSRRGGCGWGATGRFQGARSEGVC